MHHPFSTILALLLLALLNSACSNFKPVATFAVQTESVANAFEPMLAHAMRSCTSNVQRTGVITDRPYQPQSAAQDALARCQPYAGAFSAMAQLNQVLKRYADVLLALSSDALSRSKDEFGALNKALGGLPDSGGGSLLDADKVARVTRLSELISRVATQRQQRAGIAQLLEREDDIKLISDTLRSFARQNYSDTVGDESRTLALLDRALDNSAAREPLAVNTLRSRLADDRLQMVERGKVLAAYVDAIDAMQRSLAALRSKPMNDADLAQQLAVFASRVDALQRQSALYSPTLW